MEKGQEKPRSDVGENGHHLGLDDVDDTGEKRQEVSEDDDLPF